MAGYCTEKTLMVVLLHGSAWKRCAHVFLRIYHNTIIFLHYCLSIVSSLDSYEKPGTNGEYRSEQEIFSSHCAGIARGVQSQ